VHLAYIWIVSHLSAKNYRNLWKFDEVLTKTNLLSFLGHGVLAVRFSLTVHRSKAQVTSSLHKGTKCSELAPLAIVTWKSVVCERGDCVRSRQPCGCGGSAIFHS